MVERRVCTFCGDEIEPGTGRMYIKKDGVVYNFCSSKCFKNLIILGRVPRRTTWTRYYEREKQVRMKGAPEVEEKPKAKKVKKAEKEAEEKPAEEKAEPEEGAEKTEEKVEEKPKEPEKKPEPKKDKKESPAKKEEHAKKPSATKSEKPKKEPKPKPAAEAEE
jgi:large subunit ribosomal protein L24e